ARRRLQSRTEYGHGSSGSRAERVAVATDRRDLMRVMPPQEAEGRTEAPLVRAPFSWVGGCARKCTLVLGQALEGLRWLLSMLRPARARDSRIRPERNEID